MVRKIQPSQKQIHAPECRRMPHGRVTMGSAISTCSTFRGAGLVALTQGVDQSIDTLLIDFLSKLAAVDFYQPYPHHIQIENLPASPFTTCSLQTAVELYRIAFTSGLGAHHHFFVVR